MKGIMKGVGIGMAVGGAAAYFKGMMAGESFKKMARKKTKAISKAIGDMGYMFK